MDPFPVRFPLLFLTLPLLAQGTPRPASPASGRPAQSGTGLQGRGGLGFRMGSDLATPIHRLWLRNLDLSPNWSRTDPELRQIWAEELQIGTPTEAQMQALWGKQGWNLDDPRVVLVGAEDRVIASWSREPRPEEVFAALKGSGWVARLDRLQDFLREYPDQGQARLALIQLLANRARRLDPEKDASLSLANATVLEQALDRLRTLPEWPIKTPGPQWNALFRDLLTREPALLSPDLRRRLREDVEAEILHNPAHGSLWSLWGLFATLPSEAESLIARLPRLPGQALLLPGAVQPLVEFHLRKGGCTALEALASRMIPETTTWSADAAWRSARVAALIGQRRKEEAFRTLQSDMEALPDVGFMPGLMMLLPVLQLAEGEEPYLTPEDHTRLFNLIEEGRQAARAKAKANALRAGEDDEAPRLRLEVAGAPTWGKDWANLAKHPAFDDWGPQELAFGTLEGAAWKAWRERKGWGPEPRWLLRKGDDLFASGTESLPAQALADLARAQGEPRLAQIRKVLKEHPDLLAARGLRLAYLKLRMPHPRLETVLLEDAQKLTSAFLTEEFKPLPDLWQNPARRKLAELESLLMRWPEDTPTWLAWLDWSKVAGRGDAAALLQRLPLPPAEAGEEAPLPIHVGRALAEGLRQQERFKELADFGRPFWEALKPRLTRATLVEADVRHSSLATYLPTPGGGISTPTGGGKPPTPEEANRLMQAQLAMVQIRVALGLLVPWVEALRATRQGAEADAVITTLEGIQPGLGQRANGPGGNRRNQALPATAPATTARPAAGNPPR